MWRWRAIDGDVAGGSGSRGVGKKNGVGRGCP